MKVGDKVLMAFPAGNRDPEMFERADEFVIDRNATTTIAFGFSGGVDGSPCD